MLKRLLPGKGWILVDPADVRKAILEKKIKLEEARPLRAYSFGPVDERRVEFGPGGPLPARPGGRKGFPARAGTGRIGLVLRFTSTPAFERER